MRCVMLAAALCGKLIQVHSRVYLCKKSDCALYAQCYSGTCSLASAWSCERVAMYAPSRVRLRVQVSIAAALLC
jgi:hypothetical protein